MNKGQNIDNIAGCLHTRSVLTRISYELIINRKYKEMNSQCMHNYMGSPGPGEHYRLRSAEVFEKYVIMLYA